MGLYLAASIRHIFDKSGLYFYLSFLSEKTILIFACEEWRKINEPRLFLFNEPGSFLSARNLSKPVMNSLKNSSAEHDKRLNTKTKLPDLDPMIYHTLQTHDSGSSNDLWTAAIVIKWIKKRN